MNTFHPVSARAGLSGARRALVLVLVLVAWMALGNGTASSSAPKTYSADFSPDVIGAGAVTQFTVTLKNTSSQHNLGSANITPPEGFHFVDPVPARDVLELRDLNLAPGDSIPVTFKASVRCTPGSATWNIQAKQANSFNGPPGNDFTLEAGTDLTVDVVGECALRFVPGDKDTNTPSGQPTDAKVNTAITSVAAFPKGPPVQVEVIDGLGNRVTSSTASIAVRLTQDSPTAQLGSTLNADAALGVASFDKLSIDTPGSGYKLMATSQGLKDAVSNPFTIWEQIEDCVSGVCTTSAGDGAMRAEMAATGSGSGPSGPPGALAMSLGVDPVKALDCKDSFNHAPSVVRVDAFRIDGGKTVTLTIDKAYDQQQSNNGVSFYEVCFLGEMGFTDRDGKPVVAGTAGLLPSCRPAPSPCVDSKTKTRAGDVILTVLLPPGDPMMR